MARPSPAQLALLEALTPHGFPHSPGPGLCFTKEQDALFARGFPHLREVTAAPVDGDPAKIALKVLSANDPMLGLRVPDAIVKPFLRGYVVSTVGEHDPARHKAIQKARADKIHEAAPIDRALLEETLKSRVVGMGDTYSSWRMGKVLFFYEHYLGSDLVAEIVTEDLLRCAQDHKARFGDVMDNSEAAPFHLAEALPWILRRVSPERAEALRARLATAPSPDAIKGGPRKFLALLHALVDRAAKEYEALEYFDQKLAFLWDDPAPIAERLASQKAAKAPLWDIARTTWLLGTEPLAGALSLAGLDLPTLANEVAPIRDPAIVRLMAWLVSKRPVADVVGAWLREREDYARPILETLAKLDDAKESKAASAALQTLDQAPKATPPLSEEALERELARLFEALGQALEATTERDAQIHLLRDAYEAYAEARAAAGEDEAYFTHNLGERGLGQWGMLAVEMLEGA